ncbi:mycothiol system anti-sigma-R factor [Cellulomonas endophytica]|uniref:mycothiol system anti-sigma-R factor n=1 Tax=Cellulomonas endophytica TaxID=2494735 RepID=UPI0010132B8A|nr:mycothiol system anti-sigma-R factor [Cellulomonas endophytica]
MTTPDAQSCDCDEAMLRLWEYLDDELGADQAARIRAHLDGGCVGCVKEHDVDMAMKVLVRRGCQEQAPAALRVRIHSTIAALRITTVAGPTTAEAAAD